MGCAWALSGSGDGAAPDERFHAVRAGDSRGWNSMENYVYLNQ